MSTNEPPPEQPVPPPSGGYGEAAPPPPPTGGYGEVPPPPPPGYAGAPPVGGGPYSASTAWSYGWKKFTGNLGSILIAILVLVGVQIVFQVVSYFVRDSYIVSFLIGLASWIVSMIIGAGIVRGALDITEGRELDPKTLLTPQKLGEVIVASVLIGIATFIGFILLVIPGLLVAFFTSFTLYFLMDKPELGAIDAIKASFEFTKNNAGNVIVWFLLSLVTYVVGFCLCGVGLIAAIPVIILGTAYTYKTLNNEPVAA
jgi:hypothetical protein